MTESSLKTKLCSQCGFGNPAVAKFCSECGERFVVTNSPDTALESSASSLPRPSAAAPRPLDPRAALEQFLASLATEDATSQLRSSIESSRAQLKTLGVPLPKATNPLLVSLMESLKALPHTETSARIAIVTALGRTGDPAVLPPLLLVTGAQSKDVRKATAIALACIRHPLSAYLLLPMLQDGSSRVRHAAFQALIQLNQPHSMDAILAACLCGNVFRSLILETLRLVSDVKRRAFFELLGESDANQTPELRIVADWLRFEFKNAITESSPGQTANTAATARQPTPAALPQKARPQEKKSVRQPAAVAADSQSSESSVFGWGSADKSQSTPANGAASDYRYSTRTTAAVGKESQTTDHYEMTPDFADDDEYESDVRLLDSSDSSRSEDMSFFNAISDSLTDDSADHEEDGNDRSELESGSHDSPWVYDRGQNTAALMGATPGLSMPMMHPPEMKANGMQRGMMSPPAFDMTASSPLIPAFTNATSQSSVVAATTYGHAPAGSDASSSSHRSSSASAATQVVLPPDEDAGDDEIAAAAAARAAAHEKAIARLSAAREEAFRKLLDNAEEIPKVLPRLLKRRVSKLMSTPSIKTDEVAEQIRGLGATNSSAALSVLASFSQKPAKQIREACAEALGGIVHSGSAVLLLKLLTDKSGTVVEAAIRALTQIDLEPIRPVLIAAGLCGTSLRTVVTVGVESASDDKKPEWEKFLLEVLRADDPDAAAFAVSLLSRIAGDTHLEIFQNLASHKTPILRAAAVDALARTQAKRAISQINDALEDADPTVRAQAAMSVATMYSPRSLELLRTLVSDGNLSVRRNAAQTMSRIDETDLAETIARALDQETDTTTVEYLLAALQRNGGNSSLPILQRYIEGEASQFREQAVKALRKLKIPASVPIFRRLLDDHTPALRRQSVEQLAVLKAENVLPRLREMLKQDPDETVRGACAKAVGDFGDKMSLHILEEALEDRASVRLQAVIALGRLGQASAGPIMLSLLRDSLPEIRYQAVRAVAQLKLEGVEEQIAPLLEDSDEMVRRGAEQSLQDLGQSIGTIRSKRLRKRFVSLASRLTPSSVAGAIPGGSKSLLIVIVAVMLFGGYLGFSKVSFVMAGGESLPVGRVVSIGVSGSTKSAGILRKLDVLDVWDLGNAKLSARIKTPESVSGVFCEDMGGVILVMRNELGRLAPETSFSLEKMQTLKLDSTPAAIYFHDKSNSICVFEKSGATTVLRVLDGATLNEARTFVINAEFKGSCVVSPDFSMAATLDPQGVLSLCELTSGEVLTASVGQMTGQEKLGSTYCMMFSDDMKYVSFCTSGGFIALNVETMRIVKHLPTTDGIGFLSSQSVPGTSDFVVMSGTGVIYHFSNDFETQRESKIESASYDLAVMSYGGEFLVTSHTEGRDFDVFNIKKQTNQRYLAQE